LNSLWRKFKFASNVLEYTRKTAELIPKIRLFYFSLEKFDQNHLINNSHYFPNFNGVFACFLHASHNKRKRGTVKAFGKEVETLFTNKHHLGLDKFH